MIPCSSPALTLYRAAEELAGDNYGAAEAVLNQGLALAGAGRWADALPVLLEARSQIEAVYDPLGWRQWALHRALARTYRRLGKQREAQRHQRLMTQVNDRWIELTEADEFLQGTDIPPP